MTAAVSLDSAANIVDLEPRKAPASHVYSIMKRTYVVSDTAMSRVVSEALEYDLRDDSVVKVLPVGSDFWTCKRQTDVVIQGSGFARRPGTTTMEVSCSVGDRSKRVAVFGKRLIEWTRGAKRIARIGAAEPFESVPLTKENAYGGADSRVPFEAPVTHEDVLRFVATYLGPYPRNPFGKGYYVVDEPFDGIEMPNLEDPQDLLSADRLVVGDPAAWHRQPLPFCFDWTSPMMFPRLAMLGQESIQLPTAANLMEVRRGYVPAHYDDDSDDAVRLQYFQEASLGMVFPFLAPGTPVSVRGMHPERDELKFQLPESPRVVFNIEGTSFPAPANLTSVVMRPDEERVSLVYLSRVELPRPFIPGIHKYIPVSALIDGQELRYDAPVPLRERIAKGPKGPPSTKR